MKIMVWSAERGGMRSVVEAYERDGFIAQQDVKLIRSHDEGSLWRRQLILLGALVIYLWTLTTCKVELVHCHASVRGGFWRKAIFAAIARAFGIPVLFHLHGSETKKFYREQMRWVQGVISRELERASRVLVLSESWKTFVLSIAPKSRPVVVPNYVCIPPQPRPAPRSTVNLLFLGLVGPRKGVFDLLQAFANGQKQFPGLRLTIAGNGEIERAKDAARACGILDAVTFAGWVDGPGKTALLELADIYILPSYNEGLPMSVLEAMAYRLPVITTTVGGIPELITDRAHGWLLEPGDVAGLERAIVTLASSPAMREQLGLAGYERVSRHYSKSVVLPLLRSVYLECSRAGGAC